MLHLPLTPNTDPNCHLLLIILAFKQAPDIQRSTTRLVHTCVAFKQSHKALLWYEQSFDTSNVNVHSVLILVQSQTHCTVPVLRCCFAWSKKHLCSVCPNIPESKRRPHPHFSFDHSLTVSYLCRKSHSPPEKPYKPRFLGQHPYKNANKLSDIYAQYMVNLV